MPAVVPGKEYATSSAPRNKVIQITFKISSVGPSALERALLTVSLTVFRLCNCCEMYWNERFADFPRSIDRK